MNCYFCQGELKLEGKVMRRDECPHCRRDLHACVQCAFYHPAAHNQCREPMAERQVEKEKANFCGYFVFRGRAAGDDASAKAKQALNDLFK